MMWPRTVVSCLMLALAFASSMAQAQSPEASKPAGAASGARKAQPKAAVSGGTRVMIYMVCAPITQLLGFKAGSTAVVKVAGKPLGNVPSCEFKSFAVPAGEHEVKLLTYDAIIGTGLDLGFPGPTVKFSPGRTTYIRAIGGYSINWTVVDEREGLAGLAAIKEVYAKKK